MGDVKNGFESQLPWFSPLPVSEWLFGTGKLLPSLSLYKGTLLTGEVERILNEIIPSRGLKRSTWPLCSMCSRHFPTSLAAHTVQKQGFSKSSYGNVEAEEGVTCPQFAKELVVKAPRDTCTSKMLISATSHGLCFPTSLHDIWFLCSAAVDSGEDPQQGGLRGSGFLKLIPRICDRNRTIFIRISNKLDGLCWK